MFFSCRKLRKAASVLQSAGLVDEATVQKVHAVAGVEAPAANKSTAPVGARLDRARARTEGIQNKVAAAETAVVSAKYMLSETKDELRAHELMIVELEREIARGEAEHAPTRAESVMAEMIRLLAEEPDQAAWAFKARVMLQEAVAAQCAPESSGDEEDFEDGMSDKGGARRGQ